MKYDDAGWHHGGNFPEGQPSEHGGTHIALFMRWCYIQGWAGAVHFPDDAEAIDAVISGEMTATRFLFDRCDEKFVHHMLNDEGNAFAARYYGDDGLYLDDYTAHFGELMYVAPESAHDFAKFSAMIEARRASGQLTKQDVRGRPWWKFW